jgi:hypothetical protein
MTTRNISSFAALILMTALLSLTAGPAPAADSAPMTPEYAARKENHRKQSEQRITHEKRQAGADNLKAERLKVYNAKQHVKHSKPQTLENK